MACRSLADFLEELGRAGELARVQAEVTPVLEIAEVTRRVAENDGSTLLFGDVQGHNFPVLTNLLGAEARICRAIGVGSAEEVAHRIGRLVNSVPSEGWLSRFGIGIHGGGPLSGFTPRQIRSAACQQVVYLASDVDLGSLPCLKSASQETRPAITAAAVFTAEPDTHRQAAGRYELQRLSKDRLAVCWPAPDEPARLLDEYRRRAGRMPVAVVLGGDPAVLLAASALWPQVDPLALAGLLRDKALDAVSCRTVDLQVPAESDIVIEGYVDPTEPLVEAGPLCTSLGYCTLSRPVHVMHVTAMTHRANPIFPAIVPGPIASEACVVDRALARIFRPLVKLAIPELVDYDLPLSGAARHWAVLSIRKTYAGQAHRVASVAWGLRQFLFAKLLTVVDEGVDVRNLEQVHAAMAAHVSPGRDVVYQRGPVDPLDPAASPGELPQKMAIDATAKLPSEHDGTWPERASAGEDVVRRVTERWTQYGLGPEKGPGFRT